MAEENENQEDQTDGDAEGEEGEAAAGKGGNKMLIIIIAAGVTLGLLIGALVFLFLGGDDEPEPTVANTVAELSQVAFVPVPAFQVNLMQKNGLGRKVGIKVILELTSEADVPEIEKVMPRIEDDFQTFCAAASVGGYSGVCGYSPVERRAFIAGAAIRCADTGGECSV